MNKILKQKNSIFSLFNKDISFFCVCVQWIYVKEKGHLL